MLDKIIPENYQPASETYSNKYFGQNANSKDFLGAVTEKVPVGELFKIVEIGNFDQNQPFCPILKEIINEDLKHSFRGKYLLQVWNAGTMAYQRILQHPVRQWGMFRHNDTFVYLPDNEDESDQDKDVFHLVFLGGSRRKTGEQIIDEIKIPDWTGLASTSENLLLGVTSDDTLFVASDRIIHSFNFGVLYHNINENLCQVSDVDSHTFYESTIKQSRCLKLLLRHSDIFQQSVFLVPDPVKLLRLVESQSDSILIGMFESKDNLLDFCKITKEKEHISIQQLVESAKRSDPIEPDPIIKVRLAQLYGNEMFKGPIITLRQSGQIDFYWNLSLVYSTDKDASIKDYSYSDIKVNYQKIIVIQVIKKDCKKQQLEIDMTFEEQISTKEAISKKIDPDFITTSTINRSTTLGHDTPEDDDKEGCSRFSTRLLEEYYKPFQSLVLSGNNFFLAHGNFVSVYDILEGKWVAHIKFKAQDDSSDTLFVDYMAYNKKKKVIKVFRQENGDSQMAVLFQDGSFELLVRNEDVSASQVKQGKYWDQQPCNVKVVGDIVKVCEDQEHYRIIYILSNNNGQMHLWSFTKEKLFDLTTFVDGVCTETELITLFSPSHNSQIILMNKSQGVMRIYEHSIPDGPVMLSLTKIKTFRCEFLRTVEIKPQIHTAFSTDLDKNLFLLDNFNMYHFDLASIQVRDGANWIMQGRTFRNLYIVRVQLFQNRYLYVLHNSSFEIREGTTKDYFDRKAKKTNGFGVIDLKSYSQGGLNKTRPFILSIMTSVVGVNSELAFSECNQKIVFLNSYEQVKVVPLLHQNVLDFEGMLPKSNYLAMARISDKFIALDKQNCLTTWCCQTGARMAKNKVLGFDFKDYDVWGRPSQVDDFDFEQDIYSKGLFQYNLLYKQTPLEITCEDFFGSKKMQHFGGENSSYLKCRDSFHRFDLVEIKSPTQLLMHFNFDFSSEPDQHLFFNQDISLMLKIQGSTLTFYSVINDSSEGLMKKKLKIKLLNPRMPINLVDRRPYQILCLFSPDFSQYIDYCNQSCQYVVRQTFETKCDEIIMQDEIVFRIPKELLKNQALVMKQIKTQLKFIAWNDQDSIKLIDISNSDNICKVISISKTNRNEGVIVELNSSYVPFFNEEQSQGNFFKDETPLSRDNTEARLMRKHQVLRSLVQNEGGVNKMALKAIRGLLEKNGISDRREYLFNQMIKVDYYQNPNQVCIDLPFNYFAWAIMDEFSNLTMQHGKVLKEKLKKLDVESARMMLLMILPTCDTMLHKCVKYFEVIKFMHKITTKEDDFYVPFIKNLQGKTPLHLCVEKEADELRLAEYFLGEMLPKMPLDHHGKAIADIIPQCISRGLSQIKYYMDQRILTTDACSKVFRVPGQSQKINFEEDKFVSCTSLWPDKREFYSNVFETSPVERESEIKILDLPFLHDASRQESIDFFQALADLESFDLLESEAVRTVIAYRWPETKSQTLKQLFLPYCGYMAVFIFWIFVLYNPNSAVFNFDTVSTSMLVSNILCQLVLIAFSLYFIYFEFRQIKDLGLMQYFGSIWNYVDLLPPILILVVLIMNLFSEDAKIQTALQAISNFFMWFKLFYFFRIFEKTGYFINMLMKVLEDTQVFFFLLCIMMLAFASTNFILTAKTNPTVFGSLFAAYMSGIGEMNTDFSDESDNPKVIGVFFFLSTLAINIVMLNLLIAIVGIAFEDTMSSKVAANASERASMICENRNLIKQKDAQQEYLLIAQEVRTEAKE